MVKYAWPLVMVLLFSIGSNDGDALKLYRPGTGVATGSVRVSVRPDVIEGYAFVAAEPSMGHVSSIHGLHLRQYLALQSKLALL